MGKPSFPFVPVDSVEELGRKRVGPESESLGRKLDFYAIRTTMDISPGAYGTASQERLNALIEVIGLRAQPIIVSVEPVEEIMNPADLPAGQGLTRIVTPATTDEEGNPVAAVTEPVAAKVYTLRFALEHFGAWAGATPSLAESLDGVSGFVFKNGATDNVSVIRYTTL